MVAFQGDHPPFKGDSFHLRPQPSRAESSPTRSKVLPLRHGGWVPRVMQAGPGRKKPNRHARCMQLPAVTSIPPLSPRPASERADSHAVDMQPCQVGAPLRFQRTQHGGPGPHVMQPACRLLRASNCTATRATTAPPRLRNQYRDSRQLCVRPNSASQAHRSRAKNGPTVMAVAAGRSSGRCGQKWAGSNGGGRWAEAAVTSSAKLTSPRGTVREPSLMA
jgi:hypothetical protein